MLSVAAWQILVVAGCKPSCDCTVTPSTTTKLTEARGSQTTASETDHWMHAESACERVGDLVCRLRRDIEAMKELQQRFQPSTDAETQKMLGDL